MKKRLNVWAGLSALSIIAISAVLQSPSSVAQVNPPQCTRTFGFNVPNGAVLSGVTTLQLTNPTVSTDFTISRVVYRLNGKIIGQARSTTTTPNVWSMPWATQFSDPGLYQLSATILFNQTSQCQTPAISVNVSPNATTTPPGVLGLSVLPSQWSGPTNTTIDLATQPSSNSPTIPQTELAKYVVYEWSTTIGAVAPNSNGARFSSGGTAGVGRVLVRAFYGGRDVASEIPISVQSQTVPLGTTPPPSTTSQTNTTSTTSPTTQPTTSQPATSTTTATVQAPLTEQQKVELIANQINAQPEIFSCASLNLSAERLEQLRTSGRRLDRAEFERIVQCFARQNFVVPASYVPVEPSQVRTDQIVESKQTRIVDARTNQPASNAEQSQPSLRFEGQAEPNSTVLLYVFSEPLVLYAKADDKGNWTYDLVDPLEPGNHEAYAVVEESDGTYRRSSAFSFLIQTASASAENPNGYSLAVENVASLNPPASRARLNTYVVASVVVVVLVLGVGLMVLFRTLGHIPHDEHDGGQGYGA